MNSEQLVVVILMVYQKRCLSIKCIPRYATQFALRNALAHVCVCVCVFMLEMNEF